MGVGGGRSASPFLARPPHPPPTHLPQLRVGKQVEILGATPQEEVAHCAAHHVNVVPWKKGWGGGKGVRHGVETASGTSKSKQDQWELHPFLGGLGGMTPKR